MSSVDVSARLVHIANLLTTFTVYVSDPAGVQTGPTTQVPTGNSRALPRRGHSSTQVPTDHSQQNQSRDESAIAIPIFVIREFPRRCLEINRKLFPADVDKMIVEYTIQDIGALIECIRAKYFPTRDLTSVKLHANARAYCMLAVDVLQNMQV